MRTPRQQRPQGPGDSPPEQPPPLRRARSCCGRRAPHAGGGRGGPPLALSPGACQRLSQRLSRRLSQRQCHSHGSGPARPRPTPRRRGAASARQRPRARLVSWPRTCQSTSTCRCPPARCRRAASGTEPGSRRRSRRWTCWGWSPCPPCSPRQGLACSRCTRCPLCRALRRRAARTCRCRSGWNPWASAWRRWPSRRRHCCAGASRTVRRQRRPWSRSTPWLHWPGPVWVLWNSSAISTSCTCGCEPPL
mmetsp:Transcript_16031/g.50383  ORF Transcript_16031/g.50383 Transcript_16031/m.50383 type:complete len:249 (+) Transcript_16031:322-1068(+)